MTYRLVTLQQGLVNEVKVFADVSQAVKELALFAITMDPDIDEAAVFAPDGLVATAHGLLEWYNQCPEQDARQVSRTSETPPDKPIYLVCNPSHPLGFMIVSTDDPLGFENPIVAVSELGQLRMAAGNHLKLYRAQAVTQPVVSQTDVEQ